MVPTTIEIDQNVFQTAWNIVIGLIYEIFDTSLDIYNELITHTYTEVDRKKNIICLIGEYLSKVQRFKHRLFRRNTDIHIYITIMDTWQNMFLNGNII